MGNGKGSNTTEWIGTTGPRVVLGGLLVGVRTQQKQIEGKSECDAMRDEE